MWWQSVLLCKAWVFVEYCETFTVLIMIPDVTLKQVYHGDTFSINLNLVSVYKQLLFMVYYYRNKYAVIGSYPRS